MNAVVLLGPPGAGKGTVAKVLVDKGYRHVSTGDLLREQIRLETDLGIQAKKLMDEGCFVPDDAVVEMIRNLLEESDFSAKFLFDGFPRTLVQAEKFDELIRSLNGCLDSVVLLECPADALVERLAGRRTCATCGSVYHLRFNPPADGEICDKDGGELIQRPDDREKTIRMRFTVYEERTAPLISYYESQGLIKPINANQSINSVRADVVETLVGNLA